NCFESDGYPELADFATKLKVRCDKNHAVMIKNSPLLSQANECLKLARRACGEGNKKAFIALRCKMLMELSRATFDLDSEYGYMGNKTSFWAEVNFLNSGLIAVGRAKGWA
ncbi:MAG: hypothetical protein LBS68_00780, partial [Puniceicoccales bacterium]|nr:hypothetical protein [Puniceicoccales bacterium]